MEFGRKCIVKLSVDCVRQEIPLSNALTDNFAIKFLHNLITYVICTQNYARKQLRAPVCAVFIYNVELIFILIKMHYYWSSYSNQGEIINLRSDRFGWFWKEIWFQFRHSILNGVFIPVKIRKHRVTLIRKKRIKFKHF